MAETLSAAAIVTYSNTGSTAFRAARRRPFTTLLTLTPEVRTARRLTLVWGVQAHTVDHFERFEAMAQAAIRHALAEEIASSGDQLVMTAGLPLVSRGTTNGLRIVTVP